MRLEDYPKEPRYTAKVLKTEPITEQGADVEVRELVMEVDKPGFSFEVGQSIGVLVEGDAAFGKPLHHRLYTVADTPGAGHDGKPEVTIVVRRCSYIDDYSGEEYIGINSNYLCDRRPGDTVTITGPFGIPWKVPQSRSANLILVGMGTGIAPFRAFVKHLHTNVPDWKGKIWLLMGAQSGLELLYMNKQRDDFTNYYDEETFQAFKALSPRPEWADPIAWDYAIEDRAEEIWELLGQEDTYVYVAGQKRIRDSLDALFGSLCGSPATWAERKAELIEQERWVELIY
jgi:ferredoxin--NADP+ reductase